MRLESRVVKLESRAPDARRIWEAVIFDGVDPDKEQEMLDAIKARGHSAVIYQIDAPTVPGERHEA